jgi:hypothetical protein
MDSDTTNISDLPSNNINNQQPTQQSIQQNYNENIVLNTQPQQNQPQQNQPQQIQYQQGPQVQNQHQLIPQKETISIENAEKLGLTNLEQRNVRFDPTQITNDGQTNVDYIPGENTEKYIENYMTQNEVNEKNRRANNKLNSISNIYDDMQGPLLVVILYFMFQLPNTKILISKMFPSFFSSDSNLKLNGLICISLIFGLSYYLLNYVIEIMSQY